ncbi:MAG: tRNA dihydrouridine synthase DusB [Syntrophaceae bacterium]|nr:tRNA dihydrouridine synthase DusB [Syntrophaceae bacterium]
MNATGPLKIGSLAVGSREWMAPMAGVTNLPFRLIARSCGCGMAFTEMVSANGLIRATRKTLHYLDMAPKDRPLGVQIFGSDPQVMAWATRIVTDAGADMVDVNMGCPVKKVVKTGSGAALMKDPARAEAILREVRKATPLPLTVKIRAGWNSQSINAVEIAEIAERCGVDGITVHPRTAVQGYGGSADWTLIARVREAVAVPVIGNGDVRHPADALNMMRRTGCDAVMIGRACLGNPWIFDRINVLRTEGRCPDPPEPEEKMRVIIRHLDLEISAMGEQAGIRSFRKHALWYTKGDRGGAQIRNVAGRLSEKRELLELLRSFYGLERESPP